MSSCINEYLKDKMRILVTHQVQFLPEVNRIVYLNEGEIKFKGSYKELLLNSEINLELLSQELAEVEEEPNGNLSRMSSKRSTISTKNYNLGFIESESNVENYLFNKINIFL
jgi:hypothetical protein